MARDLQGKGKNELTLVIENREIVITQAKLLKTIDTIEDAFTCTMPWQLGLDPELDRITAPYSYSECSIYLGGKHQMDGILYDVAHKKNVSGTVKELGTYSKTVNIIDSSVRFPFEATNVDIFERIESQMKSTVPNRQFGIDVFIDEGVAIGGKFSRISPSQTDNCWEKLRDLARQRGVLLTCTNEGDILITKAKTEGVPVGTIQENDSLTTEYAVKFEGRKRNRYYESIASSSQTGRTAARQQAFDPVCTQPRFLTFKANDSLPGEATNAAEWRKNKSAAEAMDLSFPIDTWYAPNNDLWQVNTLVTVISETIGVKNGFTFLITQVEFDYNSDGVSANLKIKPPTVYTTGDIVEPWVN
jgi:prophage tail gpP-like protein